MHTYTHENKHTHTQGWCALCGGLRSGVINLPNKQASVQPPPPHHPPNPKHTGLFELHCLTYQLSVDTTQAGSSFSCAKLPTAFIRLEQQSEKKKK